MDSYDSEKESEKKFEEKSNSEKKEKINKEKKIINRKRKKNSEEEDISQNKNFKLNDVSKSNDNYYKNLNFKSDPKSIKFDTCLIKDSYCKNNTIIVFKSFNDILYLIYTNKQCSIISYNLIEQKKINEIKNAHNKLINDFKYFFDKINRRDLLLSISIILDSQIKVWNINNLECILNIQGYLACFSKHNNNLNIVSCNYSQSKNPKETIRIYNLDGVLIKTIENTNEKKFLLENYYNEETSKNYLIISCEKVIIENFRIKHFYHLKSYDYNKNKIYNTYEESNLIRNIVIIHENKKRFLLGATENGSIKKWNFDSGFELNHYVISNTYYNSFSFCLWNNEYLFVGFYNKGKIGLMDLKNGKIVKELYGIEGNYNCIQKVIHPFYGECLISQDSSGAILFWKNKYFY